MATGNGSVVVTTAGSGGLRFSSNARIISLQRTISGARGSQVASLTG